MASEGAPFTGGAIACLAEYLTVVHLQIRRQPASALALQKKEFQMLIAFFKGEEGAQIVEYALIIAVISLVLVVALQPLTLGAGIGGLIQQLTNCLTAVSCP